MGGSEERANRKASDKSAPNSGANEFVLARLPLPLLDSRSAITPSQRRQPRLQFTLLSSRLARPLASLSILNSRPIAGGIALAAAAIIMTAFGLANNFRRAEAGPAQEGQAQAETLGPARLLSLFLLFQPDQI